jgi:hypothetical protein
MARDQALQARARWLSALENPETCFVGPAGQVSKMTANKKNDLKKKSARITSF